ADTGSAAAKTRDITRIFGPPDPVPAWRALHHARLKSRPDRELKIRPLLDAVRERQVLLVEDRDRVEVDAVDEPERRLEDRQEDAHLDADRRPHLQEVRRLPFEPRVPCVEKGGELERPGHLVDVLPVEDEEPVAPEESALLI